MLARSTTHLVACLFVALFFSGPTGADAAPKKKTATSSAAKPKPAAKPTAKPAAKKQPAPEEPEEAPQLGPGELPLKAEGAIVIDGGNGEALYEKNADVVRYPASTTKIMTALLVIEAGNLDQLVEVTEEDARVGESSLSIKPGERYTRRDMLFGLMLKSANDVAHALGRDNGGTMAAFALKMTKRAQELGATQTSFRNPHGLHHVEHYTTPRDLAMIGRAAMQQPYFRQIVTTPKFVWRRDVEPPVLINLPNRNKLLSTFEGCTGVKSGFTNPARHTLVTAAVRNHREVIAVVMLDGKLEKWSDSAVLLRHGLDHLSTEKLARTSAN